MERIDFLAIGDVVTDAFIKVKDAHLHCKLDTESCELCFRFGDKVPFESVTVVPAVGNSPNAAVAAARLGLQSALVANIGEDENGRECLASLQKEKVGTEYIVTQKEKKTNYHYVLWYGVDRTILIKHEEFDYKFHLPAGGKVGWVYLSSLGGNSLPYHAEVLAWLEKNPETKLAFQPGTFQIKFGTEALRGIYARTDVFFCNVEEAQRILGEEHDRDILKICRGIQKLGPKTVVISDGPEGAYLLDTERGLWHIPTYPDPAPPLERTGAGDAFSATFTVALALGKSPVEALRWAPVNSMSVVQYIGAQAGLLSREKLEAYLAKAPGDYKIRKIN